MAVLTLTLGIGANTAIFSLLYQILLRPLPSADAASARVRLEPRMRSVGDCRVRVSIPDYIDRRRQAPAIEDATLFTGARAGALAAAATSPSSFGSPTRDPLALLHTRAGPASGRPFTDHGAQVGAGGRSAILTQGRGRHGSHADSGIVGRSIRFDGERRAVVGVLPADFELPSRDIFGARPLFGFTPDQQSDPGRGNEFSSMIARLRPGATIAAQRADTAIVSRPRSAAGIQTFARTSGFGGFGRPIREQLVGDARTPLLVLQAGVIFVLLIACANVASLLLVRAAGRGRELAIRTTLGAGRGRLARQMLTEGVVLSVFGGIGGLALGLIGVRALVATSFTQVPGLVDTSIHPAVLAFTMGLSIVTGLVFGLVPAMAVSRGNTSAILKDDNARSSPGRRTGITRAVLVVAETALALVLLVGAGLLIKSFARLQNVDPGFSTENVLTAQMSLPAARYPTCRRAARSGRARSRARGPSPA